MWHGPSLRNNNFDFFRLAMAVLVIYSHSYPLLSGSDQIEPLFRWSGAQLTFGECAVNVFFIISGFLITMSWERAKGTIDFSKRRIFRIVPGYLLAMVLSAFLIAPLFTAPPDPPFPSHFVLYFCKSVALMGSYAASHAFGANPYPDAVNGSLWTIHYEVGCYVAVLVAGVSGFLKYRVTVLAVFAAFTIALVMNLNIPHADSAWIRFAAHFSGGAVFYLYRRHIPSNGLLAAIAAILLILGSRPWAGIHLLGVLTPTCGTYVVMWCAFQPYVSFPQFARYGDFSYGTYLYAFPIQQMIVALVGAARLNPLTLFTIAAPLSLIAGIASWFLVEKHFVKLKQEKAPKDVESTLVPPTLVETPNA